MNKKFVMTYLASILFSTSVMADNFVIKDIRIEGLQRIEPDAIFNYLPIGIDDTFTSTKGNQIIKSLYATGYFADVQVQVQNNLVLLTVIERPIIDSVMVTGGKAISNKLIKDNLKRLGIAEAKVYDPAVVKAVTQGLQQEYLNIGKNNAVVSSEVTPLERNRMALNININEGDTTRIRKIVFEGNTIFSDSTLKRRMSLGQHNVMSFFTKNDIYAHIKSETDQKALIKYYKDRGFYDMSIVKFEPEIDIDSPKKMTLKIVVNEGSRYTWGTINVSGDAKEVPMEELQSLANDRNKKFTFRTSKWFNQSHLDNIVNNIKMTLGQYGYAKADVQITPIRYSDGSLGFDIVVNANQKVYVHEINITGNTKTRDEVIRRELRQQENAPYNSQKIKRSKERIGELGYFETISIKEDPVADNQDEVDLAVDVKEANVGDINLSVGYAQDDGVQVSGKFHHDNLWGTGRQFAIDASSSGTSQGFTMDYFNPYYTKHGVGFGFNLSAIKFDPNKIETSSYRAKTYTGNFRFLFPITDYDKINFSVGAEHKRIDLYARSPMLYKSYIQEHGKSSNIYPLSVSWRRSTIDSALWPTSGYIIDGVIKATTPWVSDHQFYELTQQVWWFFPLTEQLTFMLTGQAGYIHHYGKSKNLPFFYNFHTGGMNSVRGFDELSLGPKINNWYGDIEYIGGNKVTTATAELFFPMPGLKNSQAVRMSVFTDIGSVWDGKTYGSSDNFEYKENRKSTFKRELRYSSGIGVVWFSPLGILRFSWAKPLNKKSGDREQGFQFNIGKTF